MRRTRERARWRSDDRGVTAVEYGLVVAGVAVVALTGLFFLKDALVTSYDSSSNGNGVVACDAVDPNCDAIAALPAADLPGAVTGAPTVVALDPSGVSTTAAALNGSVTANGSAVSIDFCYQTSDSSGGCAWVAASPSSASGSVPVDVTLSATGLAASTTYNVWVRAVRAGSSTLSSPISFTTPGSAAMVVLVSDATDVTTTTATLNGAVTPNGSTATFDFCYQTSATTAGCSWIPASPSSGSGAVAVPASLTVSSLTPNTTYNVWLRGTRSGVSAESASVSFTTQALAPVVAVVAATPVGSTTATIKGTANANGVSMNVDFCYQTSALVAGCTWAGASPASVSGSSATAVSRDISSLGTATTYNVWIRGTRGTTVVIDGPLPFTTTSAAPTVSTTAVDEDDIDDTSATVRGSATANGAAVDVAFCLSTTDSTAGCAWKTASPSTVSGSTATNIRYQATSLTPYTTYYFWARVTRGATTVISAPSRSFTTDAADPTVNLDATDSITSSSATLNGTVTANGPATAVSFCVQTSNKVGDCSWKSASPSSVSGSTATAASYGASSLSANKKYYVWVRAVRGGTTVTDSGSFTTRKEPTVTLGAESDIKETSAKLNGTVNAAGNTVTVDFCYQRSDQMDGCTWVAASPSSASGTSDTSVSKAVSGLTSDKTYYVWLRASVDGVTVVDGGSFKTKK